MSLKNTRSSNLASYIDILRIIWRTSNQVKILICMSIIIVYGSSLALAFIPLVLKHTIELIQLQHTVQRPTFGYTKLFFLLIAYSVGWSLCEISTMLQSKSILKLLINTQDNIVN